MEPVTSVKRQRARDVAHGYRMAFKETFKSIQSAIRHAAGEGVSVRLKRVY
jgi:hypothetical protein